MARSDLVLVLQRIGNHVFQELDLCILPHLDLRIRVEFPAGRLDHVVDLVIVGEVGIGLGAGDDDRIRVVEAGEVNVGVGSPGDIDHDGVHIVPDQLVHAGVVDGVDLEVDADLGQLGLHALIVLEIGFALRRDQFQGEAIGVPGFGQ